MSERIEINGRPADADALRATALHTYWHFTAMQVRGGAVRGLDLHLDRLDAATREMFGTGLDGDRVRGHIRHALGAGADASVRVYVYEAADDVDVMVTVRPPGEMSSAPQSLQSIRYLRPLAHLKHGGGFGQEYHRRAARANGFDEVLLTGPDGLVAEGGITNVGLWDGSAVVWPDAPMLRGITMALLERWLPEAGVPSLRKTVRLADLASYRSVFVTNSRGIATVGRIDDRHLPVDADLMRTLSRVYESAPWDPIKS
jgi:branched-subunit amino acid aminotransferase/4-amino-4-deoxychorismate lyase